MAHRQEPTTKIEYVLFDMDGLLMYASRLSVSPSLLQFSSLGSWTCGVPFVGPTPAGERGRMRHIDRAAYYSRSPAAT